MYWYNNTYSINICCAYIDIFDQTHLYVAAVYNTYQWYINGPFQYLTAPPLHNSSKYNLVGMLWMRFSQISFLRLFHSLLSCSLNSVKVSICFFFNLCCTIAQAFSIGLRSGELGGHSSTWRLASYITL